MNSVIVLGVSDAHCATAAILVDGRIMGCASEERFSRLKTDAGYPQLANDALLRDLGLRPDQIDLVALAGTRVASRTFVNEAVGQGLGQRDDLIALLHPRLARTLSHRARQLAVKLHLTQKPKTRKFARRRATGHRVGPRGRASHHAV
jgi:predicted NodU family carbamoyl transferase